MMICYKDTTFCQDTTCANIEKCPTALTDNIQKQAEKWWGDKHAPIAVFADRLKCFEK